MVKSVIFFSFILVVSALLVLLYTFWFFPVVFRSTQRHYSVHHLSVVSSAHPMVRVVAIMARAV
jgi:hypothetical protein